MGEAVSDDLLDVLTGGKERLGAPKRDPVDALVRTVYAEADPNTDSRRAVAGVIHNRAQKAGKSYDEIVQEPGQFEPWSNPKARARMEALDPNSPEYKQIAAEVAPVISGEVKVPYDHFYAPEVMKGRGQPMPAWDDGAGQKVGTQLFFSLGDQQPADLNALIGPHDDKAGDAAYQAAFGGSVASPMGLAPAAFTKSKDGRFIFGDTGQPIPESQVKTMATLYKGGLIDEAADLGSVNRPYVQRNPTDTFKPGQFYIEAGPEGRLRQAPGGSETKGGFGEGFGAGLGDIPNSLFKMAPGHQDSTILNAMEGQRLVYDATHEGDNMAKLGRFSGQVAGAIPLMATGEGALGMLANGVKTAAPATAGVLDFLGGSAGGNLLVRGGSLATRGAAEGVAASGLVSGATDAPLGEQLATGGVIGAALGPLAPVARYAGNKLLSRGAAGAVDTVAQQATYDAARNLPVPVPLTQGQITLSPGQQMLENAMLRGANGGHAAQIMREHAAQAQGALRGNVDAIANRLTGQPAMEAGEGAALVSNKLNATYDMAKKTIDEAYDAARKAADGAYLPAAERGVMTQAAREALREYDMGSTGAVKHILDSLDQSPTSSTFTPTDIFDARAKLTTLRGSSNAIEGSAAGRAVKAIDGYVDEALQKDLISGDPNVVKAWKTAIGKRREFGKLFEGDDLINGLTERTLHGEGRTMKVSPEDAANYIFGRADMGFVGKKDLTRDLKRLQTVLGPDSPEWGALRGEAFSRLARAGEGAPEGGVPQFSGQKFLKAWDAAKTKNPQIVRTLFSTDERQLIDQFAEVAQRATTPIKGGDNPSNSAVAITVMVKKALDNLGTMAGGATGSVAGPGGAAVGAGVGRAFDAFLKDVGAVVKARKATSGAAPVLPKIAQPQNRLLGKALLPAAAIGGNRLMMADSPAP